MSDTDYVDVSRAYREIGRVANNWALLEETIEEFLWLLLGGSITTGRALSLYAGTTTRMDVMKVLIRERTSDTHTKNELNPIFREIDEVRLERNIIVHCRWKGATGTSNDPILQSTDYRPRSSLKPIPTSRSATQMSAIADRIVQVHEDLLSYFSVNFGLLPSLDRV